MAKQPAKSGMSALMGAAAKTTKVAAKKTDDKKVYACEGAVADAIKDYIAADTELKVATAKKAAAEAIIKPEGLDKFLAHVDKVGLAPESFILSAKDSDKSMLYIVQDSYKYTDLDEARIEFLQQKFGEDIIESKNEFVLNPELIDEHGETLVKLIQSCKSFSQEVKDSLIQLKQKHTIAKGSINRLKEIAAIGTQNCNTPITTKEVFEEIKPTQQLKPRGK